MEDRSWMNRRFVQGVKGINLEYVERVKKFVAFACGSKYDHNVGEIRCPCSKCKNCRFQRAHVVREHLYRRGFVANYYNWTCHGEQCIPDSQIPWLHKITGGSGVRACRNDSEHYMRDMVYDVAGPSFQEATGNMNGDEPPNREAQRFYDMLCAAATPLWSGCTTHSQLSLTACLLNIKSEHNMSERCFDDILGVMKESLPSNSKIPADFYKTKKLFAGLGLPSQKIDVCINGCMLYWKDDISHKQCKFCGHERFKKVRKVGTSRSKKQIPYKSMHYLPIIPRLQRLFASNATAEHMRWHKESRGDEGIMSHPRDGEAWKHFDATYPDFAAESRNVRLGLCSDGFAPFGMSGKQYSCWLVIVTPYNLPPWLCMKNPVMFLTMIVPGPRNPKQKIDVFMQPLMEELTQLWSEGVTTYDISRKQNFQLRAALMWTVNDFPAYGMLSGWSTAGIMACPHCMEHTTAFRLQKGKKQSWFDSHRKFLDSSHPFRRNRSAFRKNVEVHELPPPQLSGDQIWERIQGFPTIIENGGKELGKEDGRGLRHNWAKRSIFWNLPYWHSNLTRHNIDVMHNEKNVFDNVFNTVMDVKGKTKDNIQSREDVRKYCRRPELTIRPLDMMRKGQKPRARYTLSKNERRQVLEWVKELKFPDGHCSNLGRCVDLKELKLSGMKSHDCHVFMERLLPIAFRDLLPNDVWSVLTELSQFYRDLCSPNLNVQHVRRLETDVGLLICKLEKIFPPGFFDVMEHLLIHLPYEARLGGPIQYRWMYPFERYLFHLKRKVKNKSKVEGSICNAYLVEEIATFFTYYFPQTVRTKNTTLGRNEVGGSIPSKNVLSICNYPGRFPNCRERYRWLDDAELTAARNYILFNCPEVEPFINSCEESIRTAHPGLTDAQVDNRVLTEFAAWFKDHVRTPNLQVDERLKNLSWGPSRRVKQYSMYFVNGFRFETQDRSEGKATINSGVCVKGKSDDNDYFGVLKEIIEVTLVGEPVQTVVLFKCDWFDTTSRVGLRVHDKYKIVDVNQKKSYPI